MPTGCKRRRRFCNAINITHAAGMMSYVTAAAGALVAMATITTGVVFVLQLSVHQSQRSGKGGTN